MSELLHQLILNTTERTPDAEALRLRGQSMSYAALADQISIIAGGLREHGLGRNERVAVYLPKRFETVTAFFAVAMAGGVFVPINPLLKPEQIAYIMRDCNVRMLITARDRAQQLAEALKDCPDLHTVITVDEPPADLGASFRISSWSTLAEAPALGNGGTIIDTDMAAILYTSGSTGKPKGVVLSHRNMVTGAHSVAQYLGNRTDDRILAVLPFSFDYGFSQLSTAFVTGATTVLMDYLLPRDVIRMIEKESITGLAAVPPLWVQLAQLPWSDGAASSLRYLTNSGGAMPKTTLSALRQALPTTQVYLMYGLTEAFRSTFLPPNELDNRPDSMGKAIPNAEVMVVREDGSPCAPNEPGELVHRGSLVAMGYWNDPEKTGERFKPLPRQEGGIVLPEIAVWSGDTVRMDEEGFLYFVGRKDDMIKTSGYRVSPTEVEEVLYATGLVAEAVALGIPHPALGQAILAVIVPKQHGLEANVLLDECKRRLPNFMIPAAVEIRDVLPRNPNGKIDRKMLAQEYNNAFQEAES